MKIDLLKFPMLDFHKTIRSDKVLIRPMMLTDFEQMKNLTEDRNMWYYFTADLSDENILQNWIEKAISDLEKNIALPLTIISLENNDIIGTTRIGNISEANKRVEIGWTWISKDYQGSGLNQYSKDRI